MEKKEEIHELIKQLMNDSVNAKCNLMDIVLINPDMTKYSNSFLEQIIITYLSDHINDMISKYIDGEPHEWEVNLLCIMVLLADRCIGIHTETEQYPSGQIVLLNKGEPILKDGKPNVDNVEDVDLREGLKDMLDTLIELRKLIKTYREEVKEDDT